MIFTFWEGTMPAYIQLCMETWDVPHVVLNYSNLHFYTDLPVDDRLKRFSLAQIADVVRVHVLRDQGGYWLDADTILTTDKLPDGMITGDPIKKTNTIGFLHTEPCSEMFTEWAAYQDHVIADPNASHHWSVMGNRFTDPYLKTHDVPIVTVWPYWPETAGQDIKRYEKYISFYFYESHKIDMPDMLMLHNSWTPQWYKNKTREQVLEHDSTLSNILREVLYE